MVWTELQSKAEGEYSIANLWSSGSSSGNSNRSSSSKALLCVDTQSSSMSIAVLSEVCAAFQPNTNSNTNTEPEPDPSAGRALLCDTCVLPLAPPMTAACNSRNVIHRCVYMLGGGDGGASGVLIVVTATRCVVSSFPVSRMHMCAAVYSI